MLLFLLFLIGLLLFGVGMMYTYSTRPDDTPDNSSNPDMFPIEDPFYGLNSTSTDANRWRNTGVGLELTVINALNISWYDYFNKSVSDWDGGNPDSLNLQTQLNTPEPVCTSVDGVIKVCNGNYGATNWRSINKILLENGYIFASAARMNEHYFGDHDSSQRQYSMCHEMGHGFGLFHSDENFYNTYVVLAVAEIS
jgi:hypothetical protein